MPTRKTSSWPPLYLRSRMMRASSSPRLTHSAAMCELLRAPMPLREPRLLLYEHCGVGPVHGHEGSLPGVRPRAVGGLVTRRGLDALAVGADQRPRALAGVVALDAVAVLGAAALLPWAVRVGLAP